MTNSTFELSFELKLIDASDDQIINAIGQVCQKLDDLYRKVGGAGFRMPDVVDDDLQGIEIYQQPSVGLLNIILRLLPRDAEKASGKNVRRAEVREGL